MQRINNSTNNSAKNTNKITINKWKGVANGNVFAQPEYPEAGGGVGYSPSLDFSIPENSQYIGAI
jgi:hypothetical protein